MKYCIILVTPVNQNCSLVWCDITKDAAIIDPGGDSDKICEKIDKLEINIKKILITHGHIDHVNSAMELKKYYGVPIIGPHRGDELLLNNLIMQHCMLFGENELCKNDTMTPDIWLKDGDMIYIGYESFKVLHCPGHSPGHVVFFNKTSKYIIVGDVLFKNGVGRTDLPGGDFSTLMSSIRNKLISLSKDIIVLPGHGDIFTFEDIRLGE